MGIIRSAAGQYLSRQPHLVGLIKELLLSLSLQGDRVAITHDMGRAIGNTHIVATGEKDVVFYARPPKEPNSLRFVRNRSMESSHEISLVLQQDSDGNYEVTDIWVGPLYPPFPDAENANAESIHYWQTHAFTAGSEPIDAQTITKICPY